MVVDELDRAGGADTVALPPAWPAHPVALRLPARESQPQPSPASSAASARGGRKEAAWSVLAIKILICVLSLQLSPHPSTLIHAGFSWRASIGWHAIQFVRIWLTPVDVRLATSLALACPLPASEFFGTAGSAGMPPAFASAIGHSLPILIWFAHRCLFPTSLPIRLCASRQLRQLLWMRARTTQALAAITVPGG